MALPRPFMTPLPPQALPHPYLGTMWLQEMDHVDYSVVHVQY
jgi:hypothetical protein